MAFALGKDGQVEQASSEFARALRLNEQEQHILVYLLYGEFLRGENRFEESVSYLTRALSLNPRVAEAYYQRAAAYEKLEDYARAEADALAALREEGKRKDARLLLSRVYNLRGEKDKAKKYIEEVYRRSP